MSRYTGRDPSGAGHAVASAIRQALGQASGTRIGVTGLTLGSMTFSAALLAQQAQPPSQTTPGADSSDQLQEVIVTGIRQSLQQSMDIKQNAIGVVDAISAEDIGQFPDSSVGEAMQRIPGVTVNRGATSSTGGAPLSVGDASGVTIRGLGGDFNETLVDGRPMASAVVNSRAFDFASLGSDFLSEIEVLKTPDYSLSSGDIGGTINIKLPTPLDHPGPQARAFASANDSANDGQFTPGFGMLLSNTFADDTIGILVDGDYTDQKSYEHHLDIAGWEGTYLNSCQMAGGPACTNASGVALAQPYSQVTDNLSESTTPKNTTPSWYIQDYALYADRTDDRRKDGRAVIQWHPADALTLTLDDTYSDDRLLAYRSEYSVWFNSTALNDVTTDANGTVTNFNYGPEPTDFDADYDGSYIKNNEYGLNVKWRASDSWDAQLDADQSASWLNPGGQISNLDSDIGYGPSGAAAGSTN
ncbi:MAG TPA: TonB-dependent receptor plug domain-containing protein, partial [Steroidobacteraceae bacterium]|nr:TonB-dependent receptor plug domain-containing protein [Steroidobacteraceae bacterium]